MVIKILEYIKIVVEYEITRYKSFQKRLMQGVCSLDTWSIIWVIWKKRIGAQKIAAKNILEILRI